MTWRKLMTRQRTAEGVRVSMAMGSKGTNLHFCIHISADTVKAAQWARGMRVGAQLGEGDHAGMLRVAPDAELGKKLIKSSKLGTSLRVAFLPWDGLKKQKVPVEPVRFQIDGDALVLTLPSWALPDEGALVEAHIRNHGVTKCATAYAAPVQGANDKPGRLPPPAHAGNWRAQKAAAGQRRPWSAAEIMGLKDANRNMTPPAKIAAALGRPLSSVVGKLQQIRAAVK